MVRAMTPLLRPLSHLALVLTLVLTGQALAVARGGGPAGAMVVCTGRGMVTVAMGADGQPTEIARLCPDCICHTVAAILPPVGLWVRPDLARRVVILSDAVTSTAWPAPDPQARDPPRAAWDSEQTNQITSF